MAIKKFSEKTLDNIGYYVYRLVDPRDFTTFYVGKGQGNRVFDHARAAESFKLNDDEDRLSAKIDQINEIKAEGKEVIAVIHRHGLCCEQLALEVEAALIDAYPGLTNIQSGIDPERGVITAEDLEDKLNRKEYEEPDDIDYIIIKTSLNAVKTNGSLYEATRRAWKAKLERAQKYKYVLCVIYGVVREVYQVPEGGWKPAKSCAGRIEFEGEVAPDNVKSRFMNKLIPAKYRVRGLASPFLYKKSE